MNLIYYKYNVHLGSYEILYKYKRKFISVLNVFRPISLCNVIYKIISKVLVNKLKPIIKDLVLL